MEKKIREIVIAYKDRLCRFGFELIEYICNRNGAIITILNQKDQTDHEELASDIINIIAAI